MSEKYTKTSEKGHKGFSYASDTYESEFRDLYFPELPPYLYSFEKVFSQTRGPTLLEEVEANILRTWSDFNFNVNKLYECTNEATTSTKLDNKLEDILDQLQNSHEDKSESPNICNKPVRNEEMVTFANLQLQECLQNQRNLGKYTADHNNCSDINDDIKRTDKDKEFSNEKGNSSLMHYTISLDAQQICHSLSYDISELAASIYIEHLFSSYKESYTAISCWNDVVQEVSSSFIPYDNGREVMASYPSFSQPCHSFFGLYCSDNSNQEERYRKTKHCSSLQLLRQRPEQILQQSSRETNLLRLKNLESMSKLSISSSQNVNSIQVSSNVESLSCNTNTLYDSAGVVPSSVNIDAFCRYVLAYKESGLTKHPTLPKSSADAKKYKWGSTLRKKNERNTEHLL